MKISLLLPTPPGGEIKLLRHIYFFHPTQGLANAKAKSSMTSHQNASVGDERKTEYEMNRDQTNLKALKHHGKNGNPSQYQFKSKLTPI